MPAPTDVKPRNVHERSFAIVVVLFALVVFSSFVGSISAKITEIQRTRAKVIEEEGRVRDYLSSRRVSLETGLTIWSFLKSMQLSKPKQLHEEDVGLLANLPTHLRTALRCEVFSPMVGCHCLLRRLHASHSKCAGALCCYAMAEITCKSKEDLFVEGLVAAEMYFIASGKVVYHTVLYREPRHIEGGGPQSCVAEVALWGSWMHCGQLLALCSCEVVSLNVGKFREILTTTHIHDSLTLHVRRYAQAFSFLVKPNNGKGGEPLITDIVDDPSRLEGLVQEAFQTIPDRKRKSQISKVAISSAKLARSVSAGVAQLGVARSKTFSSMGSSKPRFLGVFGIRSTGTTG